ncbi:MAG TPA: TetR/AcrR family transcriptional regulator [Candidatus Limnocylindrales bacterium]|nr:TetR/AcrR family transcriptional regulator [Candidatus Limnocylindrales bacterium]
MSEVAKPKRDGRNERSAATRRLVAEAYLALVGDGFLRPTARAVAKKAGVSERAVFRHFQDLETLLSEAAMIQIQRIGREVPEPAPLDGPFELRLDRFAQRWCELHERVTPVRRAAILYEPFSPEVARRLGWIRGVRRSEIEQTFAPELAPLAPQLRRETVAVVSAACSWSTWNQLRTRHDLDAAAAHRAVRRSIAQLLGVASADVAGDVSGAGTDAAL